MEKRKSIDCRKVPSESNCSIRMSGMEKELLPLAMHHLVEVHKAEDTPEMREELRKVMEDSND